MERRRRAREGTGTRDQRGGPRDVGRHPVARRDVDRGREEHNAFELHNTADGRRVGPPIRQGGFIRSVSFAPDLASILTGSDDGAFRLWRVPDGSAIGIPLEYDDHVMGASFFPDRSRIIVSDLGGSSSIWDITTGLKCQPAIHFTSREVDFSRTGSRFALHKGPYAAQVWDIPPALDERPDRFRVAIEARTGLSWQGPLTYQQWLDRRASVAPLSPPSATQVDAHVGTAARKLLADYERTTLVERTSCSSATPTATQFNSALAPCVVDSLRATPARCFFGSASPGFTSPLLPSSQLARRQTTTIPRSRSIVSSPKAVDWPVS